MRIPIIGGGWTGCHLALSLMEVGHDIVIFEAADELFSGASYHNQCRLHLGYHYPRSAETRRIVREEFEPFLERYGAFVSKPSINVYAIAESVSLMDFETYLHIYRAEGYRFDLVDPESVGLRSVEGALRCDEAVIDVGAAKEHFTRLLSPVTRFGARIEEVERRSNGCFVEGESFDVCIDCTYNERRTIDPDRYRFEVAVMPLYERHSEDTKAITVMDGLLGSIYPFPSKIGNIHTLSSVKRTPVQTMKTAEAASQFLESIDEDFVRNTLAPAMEDEMETYYPRFREEFTYAGFLKSIKTKQTSMNDARTGFVRMEDGVIHAFTEKISNVIAIGREVLELIEEQS